VALVIGNGGYPTAPLKNPVHDARTMADTLVACGFTVTELENADQGRMREAVRGLATTLAGDGVGLFYYAGHGMQVQGRNFLVPVGTDSLPANQVAAASVDLDSVLAALGTAGNRLNILILDACLGNPFDTGSSDHRPGFTQVDAPAGTYLAFATAPGRTADDGAGADSPYTGALLRQLQVPGLKLEDVFKRARAEVLLASRQQQTPWESSSVVGDFCFRPAAALDYLEQHPQTGARRWRATALTMVAMYRLGRFGDCDRLLATTRQQGVPIARLASDYPRFGQMLAQDRQEHHLHLADARVP
jgi:uncharacterized caspase-like protein